MIKDYVVGFAFGRVPFKFSTHVVLIEKNRPVAQRGMINGVGGKIERKDGLGIQYAHVAMAREFKEETGIESLPVHWTKFAEIKRGDKALIHYFYTNGLDISEARTITDERINIVSINDFSMNKRLKPDLRWLIPMALNHLNDTEVVTHYIKTIA